MKTTRKYTWAITPERKAELTKQRVEWMQQGKKARRQARQAAPVNTPVEPTKDPE